MVLYLLYFIYFGFLSLKNQFIYLFTFSKWFISSFPQFKLNYVNILTQFMHISNLFVTYAYKYKTLFSFYLVPHILSTDLQNLIYTLVESYLHIHRFTCYPFNKVILILIANTKKYKLYQTKIQIL